MGAPSASSSHLFFLFADSSLGFCLEIWTALEVPLNRLKLWVLELAIAAAASCFVVVGGQATLNSLCSQE